MRYEIFNHDCIDFKGSSLGTIDDLYLDPPYGPLSLDTYYGVGDTMEEFVEYMTERLVAMSSHLSENANVVIHMDYKAIHHIRIAADKIFGAKNFRNEIIWAFANPSNVKKWLPRKHQNLLWYGMGEYAFNPIRVPHKALMNVGGPSAWSKEKIDPQYYAERGKLLPDYWDDIPALCRNEKEKNGYATQKPEKLLERIITLFSDKDQIVADSFCGSGTCCASALKLGRKAIGIDKSPEAIEKTEKRLKEVSSKIKTMLV